MLLWRSGFDSSTAMPNPSPFPPFHFNLPSIPPFPSPSSPPSLPPLSSSPQTPHRLDLLNLPTTPHHSPSPLSSHLNEAHQQPPPSQAPTKKPHTPIYILVNKGLKKTYTRKPNVVSPSIHPSDAKLPLGKTRLDHPAVLYRFDLSPPPLPLPLPSFSISPFPRLSSLIPTSPSVAIDKKPKRTPPPRRLADFFAAVRALQPCCLWGCLFGAMLVSGGTGKGDAAVMIIRNFFIHPPRILYLSATTTRPLHLLLLLQRPQNHPLNNPASHDPPPLTQQPHKHPLDPRLHARLPRPRSRAPARIAAVFLRCLLRLRGRGWGVLGFARSCCRGSLSAICEWQGDQRTGRAGGGGGCSRKERRGEREEITDYTTAGMAVHRPRYGRGSWSVPGGAGGHLGGGGDGA